MHRNTIYYSLLGITILVYFILIPYRFWVALIGTANPKPYSVLSTNDSLHAFREFYEGNALFEVSNQSSTLTGALEEIQKSILSYETSIALKKTPEGVLNLTAAKNRKKILLDMLEKEKEEKRKEKQENDEKKEKGNKEGEPEKNSGGSENSENVGDNKNSGDSKDNKSENSKTGENSGNAQNTDSKKDAENSKDSQDGKNTDSPEKGNQGKDGKIESAKNGKNQSGSGAMKDTSGNTEDKKKMEASGKNNTLGETKSGSGNTKKNGETTKNSGKIQQDTGNSGSIDNRENTDNSGAKEDGTNEQKKPGGTGKTGFTNSGSLQQVGDALKSTNENLKEETRNQLYNLRDGLVELQREKSKYTRPDGIVRSEDEMSGLFKQFFGDNSVFGDEARSYPDDY